MKGAIIGSTRNLIQGAILESIGIWKAMTNLKIFSIVFTQASF